jgi:hypothetical protein
MDSLSLSPTSLFFRLEKLKPSYLDDLGIGPILLVPNDQQMGSRPVGYNIHPHLDSYTSSTVAMGVPRFPSKLPKTCEIPRRRRRRVGSPHFLGGKACQVVT